MKNSEKCIILQNLKSTDSFSVSDYYIALEKIGDMKYNYRDYLITEPVDCAQELKRLSIADYNLCCALLTMLLREDHFNNGSFEKYYKAGQVQTIIDRMISHLSAEE